MPRTRQPSKPRGSASARNVVAPAPPAAAVPVMSPPPTYAAPRPMIVHTHAPAPAPYVTHAPAAIAYMHPYARPHVHTPSAAARPVDPRQNASHPSAASSAPPRAVAPVMAPPRFSPPAHSSAPRTHVYTPPAFTSPAAAAPPRTVISMFQNAPRGLGAGSAASHGSSSAGGASEMLSEEEWEAQARAVQLRSEAEDRERRDMAAAREKALVHRGVILDTLQGAADLRLLRAGPISDVVAWLDGVERVRHSCDTSRVWLPASSTFSYAAPRWTIPFLRVTRSANASPQGLLLDDLIDAVSVEGKSDTRFDQHTVPAEQSLLRGGVVLPVQAAAHSLLVAAPCEARRVVTVLRARAAPVGVLLESVPDRPSWTFRENVAKLRAVIVELLRLEKQCSRWYSQPAGAYVDDLLERFTAALRGHSDATVDDAWVAWLSSERDALFDGWSRMPSGSCAVSIPDLFLPFVPKKPDLRLDKDGVIILDDD